MKDDVRLTGRMKEQKRQMRLRNSFTICKNSNKWQTKEGY